MRNLYDINSEYLLILDELENYFYENPDAEGKIPDNINDRITINKNEMEEKIGDYYHVIKQLEAEVASLDFEINRLKNKVKAKEVTIERLKSNIGVALKTYGEIDVKSKAERPSRFFKSNTLKASYIFKPKVVVLNEENVPDNFKLFDIKIATLEVNKYKQLVAFFEKANIEIKTDNKINKTLVQNTLESNATIEGITLDKTAGYVRFS